MSHVLCHILACHLQIDADPAYHFDADQDPNFYLMRIQIRMRIHNTCQSLFSINTDQPDTGHHPRSIKSLERNCVSSNSGAAHNFFRVTSTYE